MSDIYCDCGFVSYDRIEGEAFVCPGCGEEYVLERFGDTVLLCQYLSRSYQPPPRGLSAEQLTSLQELTNRLMAKISAPKFTDLDTELECFVDTEMEDVPPA